MINYSKICKQIDESFKMISKYNIDLNFENTKEGEIIHRGGNQINEALNNIINRKLKMAPCMPMKNIDIDEQQVNSFSAHILNSIKIGCIIFLKKFNNSYTKPLNSG